MTVSDLAAGNSGSKSYKVVGTRPLRHDGREKVNGVAEYGADIQISGVLHGKILRSPHAHARIIRLDTSKAEAFPGVRACLLYTSPSPRD